MTDMSAGTLSVFLAVRISLFELLRIAVLISSTSLLEACKSPLSSSELIADTEEAFSKLSF